MSPLAALEMRGLLRQVDKRKSTVELGVEFGACDPRAEYGREVLRLALRKKLIAKFDFERLLTPILRDQLSLTQTELPSGRTLEMRTVIEHNLARHRREVYDVGAPSKDYVLVGPLVTASVCAVAESYFEETEKPKGFSVSVVQNILHTYKEIN